MERRRVLFAFVAFALTIVQGKVFSPVELARSLHQLKVSDWDIPTYVCLAHNASELNTQHKVVVEFRPFRRNVTFYGLFGIPEIWIQSCHLSPALLLDDDISDDIKCVHQELSQRISIFDRTDHLGALTPHIVDLDKCFNWWETLPPYSISSFGDNCKSSEDDETTPYDVSETSISPGNHGNQERVDFKNEPSHQAHTQVQEATHNTPSVCKCTADSRSVLTDISLVFLNLILIVLCYIIWTTFAQRRRFVDAEAVQFVNPHTLTV